MFLAALLNAHMQPVKREQHAVVVDQSSDDQTAVEERTAHLPSQTLTPLPVAGRAKVASTDARRTQFSRV